MEEKNHHEHEAEGLNPASLSHNKKLSLDTYLRVLATGDYNAISKKSLNRILSIHGFKQLKETVNKIELVEAVSEIELKDISRSTLGECIQPAAMSLEDVITDLIQLKWQTCPVASIRSINSAHDKHMASSTCDPKASGHKSKRKTGKGSKKKSEGKKARSGEQSSSVVPTKSIDSAQYNNMASSTCGIEGSVVRTVLESEKKTGNGSMKKSDGKEGRSGEQSSSVVSTKSIDSAQYNNMASPACGIEGSVVPASMKKSSPGEQSSSIISTKSIDSAVYNNIASPTCGIEESVVTADLKSEKKTLQTGPGTSELALSMEYIDVASATDVVACPIPNKPVMMDLGAEPPRKKISCDQSGKSPSSGEDNSVVQKDYGAVVIGASCSTPMAEKVTVFTFKRKRKVTESLYFHMATEGMPNLSNDIGIIP